MEDGNIANKVVIDDHITVTEGDNTTTITGDTVSTTTLSGTLDAESMKNSLTAEAVQNVAPIAWGNYFVKFGYYADANNIYSCAIGSNSSALNFSTAIGSNARAGVDSVAVGTAAQSTTYSTALGKNAIAATAATAVGHLVMSNGSTAVTIGSRFTEATDSGNVTHTCKTEGAGSITIGAGANTLNTTTTVDGVETTVKSSNSVTIGCKASNSGADSVVIGANATNRMYSNTLVGANTKVENSVFPQATAIGCNTTTSSRAFAGGFGAHASYNSVGIGLSCVSDHDSVAIGSGASTAHSATALGCWAVAKARRSTAIGISAAVKDYGATAIRSTAEDGTYTQLYFSGANTPLAKKYFPTAWEQKQDVDEQGNPKVDENGEPVMVDDKTKPIAGEAMMGFVARDKDRNIIARGANMLSALFPYYNGDNENPFTPTTMSLDGENQEPIAFHPSDLDMPIEEAPIEEEYKPLPVYPIVEPTIDEITEHL